MTRIDAVAQGGLRRNGFSLSVLAVPLWCAASVVGCTGGIGGAADDPQAPPGAAPAPGGSPTGEPGPAAPGVKPAGPPATAVEEPVDGSRLGSTELFACKPGVPASSPARLARLTAAQYENTIRALMPSLAKAAFQNPLDGAAVDERFSTFSDRQGMPVAVVDQSLRAARDLATVIAGRLQTEKPCLAAPDAACVKTALGPIGARLYRRPLAADELERLAALVSSSVTALGAPRAVSLGVQAMLASPHFMFRAELGEPRPDPAGRRRLTPYELASALSYTLTDGPPDDELMAAASSNALATREQIRAQATRLIGLAGSARPIARFFREYLRYGDATEVFKDQKMFPFHAGKELIEETDLWIKDLVTQRKNLLPALLTSDSGYARARTAPSYSLTGVTGTTAQKVTFPAGQRTGVLGQPSFLVTFSEADETDAIRRGKFVAESLLCQSIPTIPPGVVPVVPELPMATMRERLEQHRNAAAGCPACHSIMDPPGLALEIYDHVGRFRTTDHGKPIDARGVLMGSGPSDGPYKDGVELAARLAKSPAVEQCFVRHNFRYWMGRNEFEADGCALTAAHEALRRSGGDPLELVVTLLESETFLNRTLSK